MTKIAVLSETLINQIAAGEVVERPASVVKELTENALDAGATSIRVELQGGGITRIAVTDDGYGMSPADAETAILRHATSKLRDQAGLFQIRTMGFRGEAVPAIASVSRFTLRTSEAGAESGTEIRIEGGGAPRIGVCAPLGGTSIQVEDLFFNVPARRKFLKRDGTELKHAQEALLRVALAHPETSFHLHHEGSPLLTSPGSEDPRERIAAALGTEVFNHLLVAEERQLDLLVHGHVASPEFTFSTARGIYTFVNGRYVRDRAVTSAIQRAYQDSLPPGRQPVVVLFIQLDPAAVDVNVHPMKLEVRFSDPKRVVDAVMGAVTRALKSAPWLNPGAEPGRDSPQAAHYADAVERFLTRSQEAAYGGVLPLPTAADSPRIAGEQRTSFGLLKPGLNQGPPPGYFTSLRPLGWIGRKFCVCEGQGGSLVVLDPHAARERVVLSQLGRALDAAQSPQRSLFSASVELPASVARIIVQGTPILARVGIELEPFGGTSFSVSSLPSALMDVPLEPLLTDVSQALPPKDAHPDRATLAELLRVLACHAARNQPAELTNDALRVLFHELERADFEPTCRHGQVVLQESALLELVRRSGQEP